ncbi:MAG: malonyl-ACP O-methyltransferase BioC [Bacteroides sp.]
MNKDLISKRFAKAVDTYEEEAVVQKYIAAEMTRLVQEYISHSCNRILEVGCGTGLFSRMLLNSFHPDCMILNDLCPAVKHSLTPLLSDKVSFLPGDAEQVTFAGEQDLIVSCSAVQWFVSLEEFFERCSSLLTPEGYLAFSTFGQRNMNEVSALTGEQLPYRSLSELEQMLETNYELIYSRQEQQILKFASPIEVLRHLKRTGVTATQHTFVWTKARLADFCQQYIEQFSDESGTVSLTYHPIYIIVKQKQ